MSRSPAQKGALQDQPTGRRERKRLDYSGRTRRVGCADACVEVSCCTSFNSEDQHPRLGSLLILWQTCHHVSLLILISALNAGPFSPCRGSRTRCAARAAPSPSPSQVLTTGRLSPPGPAWVLKALKLTVGVNVCVCV